MHTLKMNTINNNQLIFLGTAGGRFSVFNQIRKSGGIWFKLNNRLFAIDPGPGALIESIKRGLFPNRLSGIFLSHRHLDHCADINSIIESMTEGGHKRRGCIIAPKAATDEDPVILNYNRNNFKLINTAENSLYEIEGVKIDTKMKHKHTTETYGAVFSFENHSFAYIPDTKYFEDLAHSYQSDVVIANVVFCKEKKGFMHLNSNDIYKFLEIFKPKKMIMTHFGLSFLNKKPWEIAREITKKTAVDVVAAYDGMVVDI